MRSINQFIISILVFEHVKATTTTTTFSSNSNIESRKHQRLHGGRSRHLKKGAADDDHAGDDYYEYDRHSKDVHGKGKGKGKGKGVQVPSATPSMIYPPSQPPKMVIDLYPTTHAPQQQQEKEIPPTSPPLPPLPKKKHPDKSKKSNDMNSKKISRPGKGKGKGGSYDDDYIDDDYGGKGKGKGKGGGNVDDDGGKGKGKGKGSGGGDDDDDGDGGMGPCSSDVAIQISNAIPEVITVNPISCCYSTTAEAVVSIYITHAIPSRYTTSGFEPYWDNIYREIERTSQAQQVCFVMTGIGNRTMSDRNIEQILFDTIGFVSELPNVASIMTTDPTTENTNLIDEVRRIYNNTALPSIGVFNAGYNNIIIESIVQNEGRLPYVGYLDDTEFGRMAGIITNELWNNLTTTTTTPTSIVPLCFNARIGVIDYLGDRCAAYYNELSTTTTIEPEIGVPCSMNSTISELSVLINDTTRGAINAVWAPLECCSMVADAVDAIVRPSQSNNNDSTTGTTRIIIIGCQDDDPTNGRINFYTAQPSSLQGYMTASWANYPVIQTTNGRSGRGQQYFPSLQSLVHTAIYNTVVVPP